MKTLTQYIYEDFKISKRVKTHKYHPTTIETLEQLVQQRFRNAKTDYVDLNDIDVSDVESFNNLFGGVFNTTDKTIDMSRWNMSNTKNVSNMFQACGAKQIILPAKQWGENLKSLSAMFFHCVHLEQIINLEKLHCPDVENIEFFLGDCEQLKSIDLSNCKMKNIKHASWAFQNCKSLEHFNIEGNKFNIKDKTYCDNTFFDVKNEFIPIWYKNFHDLL